MTSTAADTAPARRVPRPRADALRNRERIVSAAREMFVEFGPQVPYDEVARRAGVGNATLYRNFPERNDLVREVVLSIMARVTELAERAAEEDDVFAGLRRFTHAAADERIGALCPMLDGAFDKDHPDLTVERERLEEAVQSLVDRAQQAGRLRADVGVGDLMVAVSQLTRPLPGTACGAGFDQFVHRHLQLFLDGLEAPARSELPGTAVTLEDLRRDSCSPRTP
ncbi:TetR/AcrR family transcriptional regulator [Streptomyces zaomyceticus]|uniref:TetR/AcrR family transcriptional regulator n=1 Tax=Streptomyces zaomyceticus TaxID=68286 RepID=A0ABZ1LBU0_9ACTN|nr:TetR/AcrR family transcriptional regulator [Streptomyces zaomyceticus]